MTSRACTFGGSQKRTSRKNHLTGPLLILALSGPTVTAADVQLESPNGNLVVTIDVRDFGDAKDCPCYRVDYKGRPVIVDSRLGLEVGDAPLDHGLAVVGQTASRHDSMWKPVCGERAEIRDHYNQAVVELKEQAAPHRILHLTCRAYDEGIAFCYTLPKQGGMRSVRIRREHSEFRFGEDHATWATYAGQGPYEKVALSEVKAGCERPLGVQIADDLYAALAEAALVDYARMKFAPLQGAAHSLLSRLDGPVESRYRSRQPRENGRMDTWNLCNSIEHSGIMRHTVCRSTAYEGKREIAA